MPRTRLTHAMQRVMLLLLPSRLHAHEETQSGVAETTGPVTDGAAGLVVGVVLKLIQGFLHKDAEKTLLFSPPPFLSCPQLLPPEIVL